MASFGVGNRTRFSNAVRLDHVGYVSGSDD